MQFIDVVALYACLGKDDVGARRAGSHHYPTAGSVPGPLETRAVSPGSDAARKAALAAIKVSPSQAAYMLLKLGEALHILQDSWSHQGVPDVPRFGDAAFGCDATRAWGHPKTRGGASSHKADLTSYWPADTVAMAKATYDILTQYPLISGKKRTARTRRDSSRARRLHQGVDQNRQGRLVRRAWRPRRVVSRRHQPPRRRKSLQAAMARTQASAACREGITAARGRCRCARFLQSLLCAVAGNGRLPRRRSAVRCEPGREKGKACQGKHGGCKQ